MPKRTEEEYKQIYEELIEIQKIANVLYDKGIPKVFPWDSNADEKRKAFYQGHIDMYQDLLDSGKIQSCECYHDMTRSLLEIQKIQDQEYNFFRTPQRHKNSRQMKSTVYNLDTLIEKIEKIINKTATEKEIRNVDKSLDGFGNCEPIAYEENELLNEAKSLAFKSEELISTDFHPTLPSSNPNWPRKL